MRFYALQVVCKSCGASSLLGGSAENDLTQWRDSQVLCRRCGAEASAAESLPVQLLALPRDVWALPSLARDSPRA